MLQLILITWMILLTTFFIQLNHPLSMGLMLLIQTLLMCLLTGTMSKTFWFSYILFLVFLGGMLVLFIYVTSLASNEMFDISMNSLMFSFIIMIFISMILWTFDLNFLMQMNNNNEMMEMTIKLNNPENSIILNKIYNYPTNLITILLISYLLITLIAIVKITNIFKGPLRMMN